MEWYVWCDSERDQALNGFVFFILFPFFLNGPAIQHHDLINTWPGEEEWTGYSGVSQPTDCFRLKQKQKHLRLIAHEIDKNEVENPLKPFVPLIHTQN